MASERRLAGQVAPPAPTIQVRKLHAMWLYCTSIVADILGFGDMHV